MSSMARAFGAPVILAMGNAMRATSKAENRSALSAETVLTS